MYNITMKQRRKYLLIVFSALAITIVSLIPFYSESIFNSQDLSFHLSRIDGVLTCLQDRQFPFAIYPFKNNGYGYGSPLFYCDIFLVLPALLYRIGFSLIEAYKIFIFVSCFLGTTIFMYTCLYITNNKTSSFIATILWSLSSYRIIDIFIRAAVGEILALNFLPLFILSVYKLFVEQKNCYLLLGITFSLLLFSHNITFVLSVITFALICLINANCIIKNPNILKVTIKGAILSICLCSFYIFPMMEQMASQEFIMNSSLGKMLENGFELKRLFSDFIFQNINGQISHPLQFIFVLGIIPTLFLPLVFFIRAKHTILIDFAKKITIVCMILILFSTDLTVLPELKIFSFMQFPWRVFTIVVTISPIVFAAIMKHIPNNSVFCTLVSVIFVFCIANVSNVFNVIINSDDVIPNKESYSAIFHEQKYNPYVKNVFYNMVELGGGEYLPNTHEFNYKDMGQCISFQNYEPAICDYYRQGTTIIFKYNYSYEERVLAPLSYYKGYKTYEVDHNLNIIREINIAPDAYSKRVSFIAEKGEHLYLIKYEGTNIQKISLFVSLIGLAYIMIYMFKNVLKSNSQ